MLGNYLAAALRNLVRNRLNAMMTILGLAVAMAASILIAVFVRDEHRYDRFPNHERTFAVLYASGPSDAPAFKGRVFVDPYGHIKAAELLQSTFPEIEATTRVIWSRLVFARGQVMAEQDILKVDPNFFDFFPFKVIDGATKGAHSAPNTVVLTRSIARKYFGRDDVAGETLNLSYGGARYGSPEDRDFTALRIAAVIEDLPSETHIEAEAFLFGGGRYGLDDPKSLHNSAYVRLRPGADAERLEAAMQPLLPRIERSGAGKAKVELWPIASLHLPPDDGRHVANGGGGLTSSARLVKIVAALGVVILAVAALNFVSLMTANGARRSVEIGVRKAAGARRRDLVLQFMGEAVLYVFLALIFAAALVEALLPALNRVLQRSMVFDYYADPPMLALLLGGSLSLGLLAGAYPALVVAGLNPVVALKGALKSSRAGKLVRQGLVAVQFAVLTGLLLTALTFHRQTAHAVDAAVALGGERPILIAENSECDRVIVARIEALQGVLDAACGRGPLSPMGPMGEAVLPDGRKIPLGDEPIGVGFLQLYGFKPLAGRLFQEADLEPAPVNTPQGPVVLYMARQRVVINEAARKALGFASPQAAVGARIAYPYKGMPPREVIGVIADHAVRSSADPQAFRLTDPALVLSIKLSGTDVGAAIDRIDNAWRELGNMRPLPRRFLSEEIQKRYEDVINLSRIVAACAAVALFIALLGMFALSAFIAHARIKEIGVRKALGARTADVAWLMLRQFSVPVLAGTLVAWPIAYVFLTRWLSQFGDPVGLPPWLFLAVLTASLAVAWTTVLAHTLAVSQRNPVTALRYE